MLKIKWLIAAIKAETVPVREAIRAVIVVPIFAPSVKGKSDVELKPQLLQAPGTTREVVMDELCTIIVINTPKPTALSIVLNMYWIKNASIFSRTRLLSSFTKA